MTFFSVVLERVPKVIPHEEGYLTRRALEHTIRPRFLFPYKPDLGSDSWIIQKYAGLHVAGEEEGTSVGLGYIPEFYIDFGAPVMFVPIFILGLLMGLMYASFCYFSPSYALYSCAATILAITGFSTYGAEIAKLLGGIMMQFLVYAAILYFICPFIHRKLLNGCGIAKYRKAVLRT